MTTDNTLPATQNNTLPTEVSLEATPVVSDLVLGFRRGRIPTNGVYRGNNAATLPPPNLIKTNHSPLELFFGYWIISGLTILIVSFFANNSASNSFYYGFRYGFYAAVAASLAPLLFWALEALKNRSLNLGRFLSFSLSYQRWYCYLISGTLLEGLRYLLTTMGVLSGPSMFGLKILILAVVCALILPPILQTIHRKSSNRTPSKKTNDTDTDFPSEVIPDILPFGLFMGQTTGRLEDLNHSTAVARGQKLTLSLQDATQNILVLGGIGSGKTTRAMQPMLLQLLDQDCGGLIFDIKGDFGNSVETIAREVHTRVDGIGPGYGTINLLAGLSPEMASSFLKSIFLLNSGKTIDSFWIDTAAELCRNALGVLQVLDDKYSLDSLYSYIFEEESKLELDKLALSKLMEMPKDSSDARLLRSYQNYQESIFKGFDDKVKSGVRATIAQVLSPFNHPELIDTFCIDKASNTNLTDVLLGKVFIVNLPLSKWGLGAKVVYTLIKLKFFNIMQQRRSCADWNQVRPVFFMCDEYQEIVAANRDGLSDLNFWDKSRSSHTIGIISAQSISSFYAAIGNRETAAALLQNFRQRICFRTEDEETLKNLNQLAGSVDVIRKGLNETAQSSVSKSSMALFESTTTNGHSVSYTHNFVEKSVISPQLVRSLGPNQAVALLSLDNHSCDDVVDTFPVYA